jgi:hypothetical protein
LRTSIQLADFVELCSLPGGDRAKQFDVLLSGILDQITQLSESIAQLYFSHALVSREMAGMREEPES